MKKKGLLLGIMPIIAVWFVLALMMARAHADTNVSGYISSDTTWTATEIPYIATGSVIVKEGVTLTIEPGVTVKFDDGKALQIQGELVARGSSASPITFTKSGSTNWGYILFEDTSTDADYDSSDNYTSGSIMEYCTVEYAGNSTASDNGAVRIDDAYPHISHCTIKNNLADGIHAYNLGRKNFTISDCESSENSGSGIYCYDRNGDDSIIVKIRGCTIKNNKTSSYGGGINAYCYSSVTVSNCTVTGNTSSYNGGGIYAADSPIIISDCTVTGNTSSQWGGGIYAFANSTVSINNCTVTGNTGGRYGGGIYAYSIYSSSEINNCTISENTSMYGGGICADGFAGTISDCTITGNIVDYDGGGIYGEGVYDSSTGIKPIRVSKCIISKNEASSGAGIYGYGLDISYCTITNNKTENAISGAVFIIGYDISSNSSDFYPVTLNNSNIYNNTADYELWNDRQQGSPDVDATNNWWGTTDDATIQEKIYDFIDDSNKGMVEYSPYATAFVSGAPDPGETSTAPTATTSDATSITSSSAALNGTVNANGSDATVWFEYGSTSGSYGNKTSTQTVTGSSDTDVTANITGLTANTTYYYRVVAENSGGKIEGSEKSFTTSSSTSTSTGYISGRVTDADTGLGISGATVSTNSGGYSATTDSTGNYQVSNVATGSYTLTASATGYDSDSESITVTANAVTTADFSLNATVVSPSTGVISGSVLDANTGKGISGATVSTDTGGYSATTNGSGSYTISNVDAGNYTLTAEAEGYEPESQEVTVTANALTTANFSLSAEKGTSVIFGSVEDEYGDPFPGVEVTIEGTNYIEETETDEDGDYVFIELAAGEYTLTFSAKGYETQTITVEIEDDDEYEVDTLEMLPEDEGLGLIYGYVYDIEGEPIESVKVTIKGVVSGEKSNEYTDADGFFEFSDVESGTYKLSAKKKGYKKSKETVSVKSSQEKYVEIELRKSSKSRSDKIEEAGGAGIGL